MRDTERSSAMPIRIAMLNVISAYREITPKVLHDTPFHTPQYRHLTNIQTIKIYLETYRTR